MKNLVLPVFVVLVTIALGTAATPANASVFRQTRPTPSPTYRHPATPPVSQQKTTAAPTTSPTPQSSSNSSAVFLLSKGNEDYAAAEALISTRQASQGSAEKLRSAINYYTRAIETDPKLARAYLQRAMSTALLYFNNAVELRKAIADLDIAISLEPTATAYYERAKARTRLSRVDKSVTPSMVLSDLNDGQKRDGKFFPMLNARAQVHFGMGNYALALADVNESLRLFSFQSPIVEFKKQIEAKIASSSGTLGGATANTTNPTPKATGTPAMKPPVYTWATAETLTSVTQVTDVKPTDSWYSALQILIEKYGIVGLTEGKKLSPNQNLTPAAYRTIRQSARVQLQQVASRTGMLSRRFDELFPTDCPDPKVVADGMTSGEVVNSLKCIFGPSTLKAVYPDRPMTRGYFVQVFDDAVENGSAKIASNSRGETGPTKTSATPAELKALIDQGQRLMGSKDYDGAIRMFNQVIEYDANYIEAYRLRGVSALLIYEQNPPMQGQKLYTALFNFDYAINRGSNNPDDYYLRGVTHERQGKKDKAIADYRAALKLNSNHEGSKDSLKKLGVAP